MAISTIPFALHPGNHAVKVLFLKMHCMANFICCHRSAIGYHDPFILAIITSMGIGKSMSSEPFHRNIYTQHISILFFNIATGHARYIAIFHRIHPISMIQMSAFQRSIHFTLTCYPKHMLLTIHDPVQQLLSNSPILFAQWHMHGKFYSLHRDIL